MKCLVRLVALALLTSALPCGARAQWQEIYATYDDADSNGAGYNVTSVGVIHEDMFIAMVAPDNGTLANFMIPYVDATAGTGRRYSFGYYTESDGFFQFWSDEAFDQVQMIGAMQCRATADSHIYVANNDIDHNVLVFKYADDTIKVVPNAGGVFPRVTTGPNGVCAIDVDHNGYVYVCHDTTRGLTGDVKIYPPINQWTIGHADAPVNTIDLPDGVYKGLAVSPDGSQLFVSDFEGRKVLKYTGTPAGGYTAAPGFSFAFGPADTIEGETDLPSLLGMAYLTPNNILAVAADTWGSYTYSYGRIYLLNANTGALVSPDSAVSVIDQARWNWVTINSGDYYRNGGKDPANASGYTTTYDVQFGPTGKLYSLSCNGWTVEKWEYVGTLPVVTGLREMKGVAPESYRLGQNYPNPFNPSTTIDFAIAKPGFVTLKVFNLIGQEVATLVRDVKAAGTYRATFDAHGLPSGAYFYSLQAGPFTETRQMLLVK